jgi:hypothetical protein
MDPRYIRLRLREPTVPATAVLCRTSGRVVYSAESRTADRRPRLPRGTRRGWQRQRREGIRMGMEMQYIELKPTNPLFIFSIPDRASCSRRSQLSTREERRSLPNSSAHVQQRKTWNIDIPLELRLPFILHLDWSSKPFGHRKD